nr:bacteriophage holin [Amycolatopsis granulosa]
MPSVLLAAAGVLALIVVLIRTVRVLRRFRRASSMVTVNITDRTGLLKARSAGLRVAIEQRRRPTPEQVALVTSKEGGH